MRSIHYGTAPTKTMALYKGYLHRFLVFRRQLYMQRLDLLRKLEQRWSLLPTFGFQAPEAINISFSLGPIFKSPVSPQILVWLQKNKLFYQLVNSCRIN